VIEVEEKRPEEKVEKTEYQQIVERTQPQPQMSECQMLESEFRKWCYSATDGTAVYSYPYMTPCSYDWCYKTWLAQMNICNTSYRCVLEREIRADEYGLAEPILYNFRDFCRSRGGVVSQSPSGTILYSINIGGQWWYCTR
jgi:hypothetical protein